MKRHYILGLSLAAGTFLCLSLHSCGDKFLEAQPSDLATTSNYFRSEGEVQTALTGLYDGLQVDATQSGDWQWFMEGLDTYDVLDNSAPRQRFPGSFDNIFNRLYRIATSANTLINRVEQLGTLSDEKKTAVIAQARFLRGLAYFNLGRWYGNVPVITVEQTSESNFQVPRNTQDEVYAQAREDFAFAATPGNLPVRWDDANVGRATQGAALGFLAKVDLYRKDYEGTIAASRQIEALNPPYQLLADYNQVWDVENNEESLFEVQYRASSANDSWWEANGDAVRTAPGGIGTDFAPGGGWGAIIPSTELYAAFEEGDQRKKKSILAPGDTLVRSGNRTVWNGDGTVTRLAFLKHWREASQFNGFNESAQNMILLRYAEVLLNYAEALNEQEQTAAAIAQVNRVRRRANLPDLPEGLSKAQTLDAIFQERRVELCNEFSWWSDLVRTGRLKPFIEKEYGKYGIRWEDHWGLRPIPPAQIDLNPNLRQNPGYQ